MKIKTYQKPIKFLLVGGVGFLIQLSLLLLFTEVFHFWYVFSFVLAVVSATTWNYLMHNFWTFRQRGIFSE